MNWIKRIKNSLLKLSATLTYLKHLVINRILSNWIVAHYWIYLIKLATKTKIIFNSLCKSYLFKALSQSNLPRIIVWTILILRNKVRLKCRDIKIRRIHKIPFYHSLWTTLLRLLLQLKWRKIMDMDKILSNCQNWVKEVLAC